MQENDLSQQIKGAVETIASVVKPRKKVGLALGSGGWRGLAHIGVIKALVQNDIPIDIIAGSSVGAVVGGLYAALGDINKVQGIVSSLKYKTVISVLMDPSRKYGLVKGERLTKFFEKIGGSINIEDLDLKYCAVTTDIVTGETIFLKNGNLAIAMRASSSVPLVLMPVEVDGRKLVDGGTSLPVPVDATREMGADIVIGVNLYGNIFPMKEVFDNGLKFRTAEITRLSYQLLLAKLAQSNIVDADIALNPKIPEGKFDIFFKFVNNIETIRIGEEAMLERMDELKEMLKA